MVRDRGRGYSRLTNAMNLQTIFRIQPANFWVDKTLVSFHPPKKNMFTLPETNMAPENNPLEKEIPIGNHHF